MTRKKILSGLMLAAVCLCLPACAAKREEAVSAPQQRIWPTWPDEVHHFRHKVYVDIPDAPQPLRFDGVMRFDAAGQSIRVVGMGPFGLTLFDISVTPYAVRTAYLHPSLARIAGIDREIGRCVRALWFTGLGVAFAREPQKNFPNESLPDAPSPVKARRGEAPPAGLPPLASRQDESRPNAPPRNETAGNTALRGATLQDQTLWEGPVAYHFRNGRLDLVSSKTWSASFSQERPWPRTMNFHNQSPGYTVRVKLVDDTDMERKSR